MVGSNLTPGGLLRPNAEGGLLRVNMRSGTEMRCQLREVVTWHVVAEIRRFAGEYTVTILLMQVCVLTVTSTCYYILSCFNNGLGG
jgi:hypothetical protein